MAQDWPDKITALKEAVDSGLALLAIAAGFQLLGTGISTVTKEMIPGAGIFNMVTEMRSRRLKALLPFECPVCSRNSRW